MVLPKVMLLLYDVLIGITMLPYGGTLSKRGGSELLLEGNVLVVLMILDLMPLFLTYLNLEPPNLASKTLLRISKSFRPRPLFSLGRQRFS